MYYFYNVRKQKPSQKVLIPGIMVRQISIVKFFQEIYILSSKDNSNVAIQTLQENFTEYFCALSCSLLRIKKPPILEVFIINIFHNIIISPCRLASILINFYIFFISRIIEFTCTLKTVPTQYITIYIQRLYLLLK